MKLLSHWFVLGLLVVCVVAALTVDGLWWLPLLGLVLGAAYLVLDRRFAAAETPEERLTAERPRSRRM